MISSTAHVDKKVLEEGINISLPIPVCIFIYPLKSDIHLYNKTRCVCMSVAISTHQKIKIDA
jgi:hypothetical protein